MAMSESVSLQHTLMRTHAAEKVYQLEQQHSETEQHRFSLELERRDLEDQQRTPPSHRTEGGRVDRERERRKEERRQKKTPPSMKDECAQERESAPNSEGEGEADIRGRWVDLRA